jgi:uncharacterized repeat protein (TIGR03833 family)
MRHQPLANLQRIAKMAVPTTRQVVPGAAVSIVLKADQRTGREVQGVVRDVLTRGDHHRGIKVRLADGRIGRVQRMDTGGGAAAPGRAIPAPDGSDGEQQQQQQQQQVVFAAGAPLRSHGRPPRFRDVRNDEHLEAPRDQLDLGAYIVAPKRKGKNRGPKRTDNSEPGELFDAAAAAAAAGAVSADASLSLADVSTANISCPVCGAFGGDEAAVAHHVSGHFD